MTISNVSISHFQYRGNSQAILVKYPDKIEIFLSDNSAAKPGIYFHFNRPDAIYEEIQAWSGNPEALPTGKLFFERTT